MSFELSEGLLPKLGSTVRATSGLNSNDINFYKSVDKPIEESSNKASDKILSLINDVLTSLESTETKAVEGSTIKDSWNLVSTVLDNFFESSDISLDEHKSGSKQDGSKLTYLDDSTSLPSNQPAKKILKPQLLFKTPVDNNESGPFKPLLNSKPHAVVPFEETFTLTDAKDVDPSHYRHPYETEIMKQEYNPLILEKAEPVPSNDWDSTQAVWVDNVKSLKEMLEELKSCTEIAVDLEHHDYRTYYGLVCLMQISSRERDWIVDTLALREELSILNEVFADPQITKVFHGAFMDIIWLQRDLGLYVVSLFDTYHASKALSFPKMSLAYLLERFAQFKTSKKYQLADWRTRPLNNAMMSYARADTHFLLNIYDQLKNMLLGAGKMGDVLFESRNVAIRRFEYTAFRPTNSTNQSNTFSPIDKRDPWKSLVYQYNLPPSRTEMVKALYEWRDQHARAQDESTRYIMSNQLLVSIASLAPTDSAGVLAASPYTTEYVRRNSKSIALLIETTLKNSKLEDITLLNSLSNSYYDLKSIEEVIDIDSVRKQEQKFISELKSTRTEEEQKEEAPSFSIQSSLFGEISLCHGQLSVERPEEEEPLENIAISERIKKINTAMDSFNKKNSALFSSITSQISANVNEDDSADLANRIVKEDFVDNALEAEPSQIFDDKDEVITLKNKRNHKKEKVGKKQKSEEEDFNYANARTVIKENSSANSRNNKKRSGPVFDPYSQESESGRPLKKQSKMLPGKTMSFVSKRKK